MTKQLLATELEAGDIVVEVEDILHGEVRTVEVDHDEVRVMLLVAPGWANSPIEWVSLSREQIVEVV